MIKTQAFVMPRRNHYQVKGASVARKSTEMNGVSITSGISLKSGRRIILKISFLRGFFQGGDTPEAWVWRNYARIKQWEAGLNLEAVAPELVI